MAWIVDIGENKTDQIKPSLKETLLDFNIGYVLVASLSVLFLILGTYIFYGTGNALPTSSGLFAHNVVQIYTETIGSEPYCHICI